MLGLQLSLSTITLLVTISLASDSNYKCATEDGEDCQCIFPFKYNGVSYTDCTDVDEPNLWCATSLDDNGEYLDYGWCKEKEAETEEKETREETVDVCAGQCEKANQQCQVEAGQPVCKCLDGYVDENNDGYCKCVRDWVTRGTRGDLCTTCPRGFELKTWQHKTTKKQKQWCHREARECNPDRLELNANYPNVQRIGQGYNILLGNLLELPALDSLGHNGFRGLHKRIFNPYSVDYSDSRDDCKINGYILDKSRNCRATLKTTVFSNSKQVVEKIEEKVKTGETVEEFTFSVSEGENAQYSNSVSFGSSFSQSADTTTGSSSNHCVDESESQSTETGKTVEKSSSSETSKSFEETQSESANTETSESDTRTSSSSREQSSSSTSEVGAEVSVSASIFGITASASASTSFSNTQTKSSTTSNENSKTNSFTQGYSSEYGLSKSESNSNSASNSDSFTNTASNQKTISTNICSEGSQSSTNTAGKEARKDQNNEYNSGSTFEKSFEIPGDARSVDHSTAVAESEEFFQEYSGSISHTEASCMKFSARLNDNSPPAFTKDFKDIIREMDSLTEELWDSNIETKKLDNGTLISRKNEKNEKKFDALFQKFIENFGTHYIQKAVMGGIQRISSNIKSLKEDEGNVEQVENCLNKAIKEKRKDKSVQDGTTNDNCNNKDIEERVKSSLKTTEDKVNTFGAGANENIYQWTTNSFDNPTLLPNFKLQPIVKLFQPKFMNSKRVTRKDGTAINYKRILSWLMPRYAILVGRCKLMKNHRVSEGKTCLPNKEFLVSTRDGNDVTHLAALCRSLPDHLLEDGATDCTWCPGGVDHSKRTCKGYNNLELYKNEDWK